jgi:hypothetical protein
MRVLCIAKLEGTIGANGPVLTPEVLEECQVTGEGYNEEFGKEHTLYQLAGYPQEVGYQAVAFAILPEADADEINAAEAEAIVPAPVVESDPLSIEESALQAYINTYELTGDEHRAAQVYYEMLNTIVR